MGSSSWNHYVTLVGYDVGDVDASGEPLRRNGYWILRNSWGDKWGVGVRPAACPSPFYLFPPAQVVQLLVVERWGRPKHIRGEPALHHHA